MMGGGPWETVGFQGKGGLMQSGRRRRVEGGLMGSRESIGVSLSMPNWGERYCSEGDISHSSGQVREDIRIAEHGKAREWTLSTVRVEEAFQCIAAVATRRQFFESNNSFGGQQSMCRREGGQRVAAGQDRVGQFHGILVAQGFRFAQMTASWVRQHLLRHKARRLRRWRRGRHVHGHGLAPTTEMQSERFLIGGPGIDSRGGEFQQAKDRCEDATPPIPFQCDCKKAHCALERCNWLVTVTSKQLQWAND